MTEESSSPHKNKGTTPPSTPEKPSKKKESSKKAPDLIPINDEIRVATLSDFQRLSTLSQKLSNDSSFPPASQPSSPPEALDSSQGSEDRLPLSPPHTPMKQKPREAEQEEEESLKKDLEAISNIQLTGTTSTKINYLIDRLRSHPYEKTIIFSQYINTLYHICEALQVANLPHLAFHSKIVPTFCPTPTFFFSFK